MKELHSLSHFITGLDYGTLPEPVVERARWVMRDTLGVIIGGMAEAENSALAAYAARTHPGGATLFGHGGQSLPEWAAMVHGTAGTTLEMDEGHAFARGHAAIHALPPALALAQARRASGQQAVAAFVAGYEVAARAGIASRLRDAVHPFGAWGVLGAAAVAAWLDGFGPGEMVGALELAASYAITPSFKTAYQGANVRNTYAGLVNHLGLLAVQLYRLGYQGERGGLKTSFGEILGHSFDAQALVDGLGERFEILRGYFKPYSACRYTHAAIDAVLGLRAMGNVEIERIASVEVATYDLAARLIDPRPSTPLAGRFSLPYVTAAALVTGGAGPEIFTAPMLQDQGLLDLASRVRVRPDQAFTAMTPKMRPARVTLQFSDGSSREKTVTGSIGDPGQPMSAGQLQSKFRSLTTKRLGPDRATQAWDLIGELDRLDDLSPLIELLAPEKPLAAH